MNALIPTHEKAKSQVDRLKKVWKVTGISQTQIAGELGVSYQTVNSWLCGRTMPRSQAQIQNIDSFLGRFKNIK